MIKFERDIKGHEHQYFKGLFSDDFSSFLIQFIQLESHFTYLSISQHESVIPILKNNGFEKLIEIKHGFGNFPEIISKQEKLDEIKYCNTCL
jgi:hypothetical protein